MTLTLQDQRLQGWLASGAFHFLLALLFLVVMVETRTPPEPLAELLFLAAPATPSQGAESPAEGLPAAAAPRIQEAGERVLLPQRRPLNAPPETALPTPQRRDLQTDPVTPSQLVDRLVRPGLERPVSPVGMPEGAKRTAPTDPLGIPGALPGDPAAGSAGTRPWEIEWSGAGRDVVRSVLPEVPAGVEREVVLRFAFAVTPAGEVTALRPLQKGEPALEEASLTALRQWRFQALPAAAPQLDQEAVITFRFRIR